MRQTALLMVDWKENQTVVLTADRMGRQKVHQMGHWKENQRVVMKA